MPEFRSYAHTMHGLQVQQASGEWKDVTVPAGHVLVLPGYTLERATCGLVKATIHRVSDCMQKPHLALAICRWSRHVDKLTGTLSLHCLFAVFCLHCNVNLLANSLKSAGEYEGFLDVRLACINCIGVHAGFASITTQAPLVCMYARGTTHDVQKAVVSIWC